MILLHRPATPEATPEKEHPMSKTQTRGNCPCCGREQAILASGRMSKHGYTVENGWFNGVCGGDRFEPMQIQREVTDQIIITVRQDVKKLEAQAADLRSGRKVLGLVPMPGEYVRRGEKPTMVEWKDLGEYKQQDALNSAIYGCESRARVGASFANDMERILNAVHGQPLKIVELDAAPAPIRTGERRKSSSGSILVCRYTERGRVYYTTTRDDGSKFQSWEGVQSWRKMEVVE
jgi:hypothetical protein